MIKDLIARGIGFSPGSVKYVPTHGLSQGAVIVPADSGWADVGLVMAAGFADVGIVTHVGWTDEGGMID
jgi:hypothetical protein